MQRREESRVEEKREGVMARTFQEQGARQTLELGSNLTEQGKGSSRKCGLLSSLACERPCHGAEFSFYPLHFWPCEFVLNKHASAQMHSLPSTPSAMQGNRPLLLVFSGLLGQLLQSAGCGSNHWQVIEGGKSGGARALPSVSFHFRKSRGCVSFMALAPM